MLFTRYDKEVVRITDEIIKKFESSADPERPHGHATQIIWATSNKLGCAYKKDCPVRKHLVIHNCIFLLKAFIVSRIKPTA